MMGYVIKFKSDEGIKVIVGTSLLISNKQCDISAKMAQVNAIVCTEATAAFKIEKRFIIVYGLFMITVLPKGNWTINSNYTMAKVRLEGANK